MITKAPEKWILVNTKSMQFYHGCRGSNEVKKMWNKLDGFKLILNNIFWRYYQVWEKKS